MNQKKKAVKLPQKQLSNSPKTELLEYPLYPVNEDIYLKSIREEEIDPEYFAAERSSVSKNASGIISETQFISAISGSELDVPGAELDDKEESIGSEDEENNYYSFGGDDHNDLDENNIE